MIVQPALPRKRTNMPTCSCSGTMHAKAVVSDNGRPICKAASSPSPSKPAAAALNRSASCPAADKTAACCKAYASCRWPGAFCAASGWSSAFCARPERILRSVLPMPRPCVDRDVMIGWQLKVPLRLQRAKKCSLCGALLWAVFPAGLGTLRRRQVRAPGYAPGAWTLVRWRSATLKREPVR